jgi:hypothetical protein
MLWHTHTQHTYVHTHTHTHTNTYIPKYVYIHIHTYIHTKKWKNRSDKKMRNSSRQLLEDLKETRGYWALEEEALDRTLWRTSFGGSYGPVVVQTTVWTNTRTHTHTHTCILTLMEVKINSRYDFTISAQEISCQLWPYSPLIYWCKARQNGSRHRSTWSMSIAQETLWLSGLGVLSLTYTAESAQCYKLIYQHGPSVRTESTPNLTVLCSKSITGDCDLKNPANSLFALSL